MRPADSVDLWGGNGAEGRRLMGAVNKRAFRNLNHGFRPASGEQLTTRLDEDRTPGYGLTCLVPKPTSVRQSDPVPRSSTTVEGTVGARLAESGALDPRTSR